MAEDDAQKTEEPTGKKRDKARKKGNVANSTEVKNLGLIFTAAIGIALMAPSVMGDITQMLVRFLATPENIPTDFEHLRLVLGNLMRDTGMIMWPFFGIMVLSAIGFNVVQVGLLWAPKKIKPELSKISLIKGVKKKFSMATIVEFLKGIVKLGITALVSFSLALPLLGDVTLIPDMDFSLVLERIYWITLWLLAGTLMVMTALAALDLLYTRYSYTKSLRMTKQEVKDEHKESEGDPQVKTRIKKLRYERAQQRMMAAVPEADVVITNPTYYAVALEYKSETMAVPKLIAKGIDSLARNIREVAEEHDVPIVENPPLARALYATVELEEEIPEEHFLAVAEVIGYVMRLKGEIPSRPSENGN